MPNDNQVNQPAEAAIYENKAMLKSLLLKWRDVIEPEKSVLGDERLVSMIRDVKKYANMNHKVSYAKEGQLYNKILKGMQKYSSVLEKEMQKSQDSNVIKAFSMMSDLNDYFVVRKDGYLSKPASEAHHIVSHDKQFKGGKEYGISSGKMVKYKDTPLFSHDPSIEDIKHGSLKNTKVNAALGAIVQKNPDFIKESMLDNKDGTVTVRLFQPVQPVDQGNKPTNQVIYKPVYVTVDKTMPEGNKSQTSLWMNLYEKALVASGMFCADEKDPYPRAVPQNIDELYSKYSKLPKTEWPTRQECPWLIGEDGELHKWNPSYEHPSYSNTSSTNILACLMGEEGRSSVQVLEYVPPKAIANNVANKFLEDFYVDIIKGQTNNENATNKIVEAARLKCKDNPQVFLENLLICAAKVSTNSLEEIDNYFKNSENIEYDQDGRMVDDSDTYHKTVLQNFDKAVKQGMDRAIQNGETNNPKQYVERLFDSAVNGLLQSVDAMDRMLVQDEMQSIRSMFHAARAQESDIDYLKVEVYTEEQKKLFENIDGMLKQEKVLIAGTREQEVLDIDETNSLEADAAYGIVGVTSENHNGREYKYVLLTDSSPNKTAVGYDYSQNPPLPIKAAEDVENGIKKVEFNHFCASFDKLAVTGVEKAPSIPLPANMLTRPIISEYSNFMDFFANQLDELANAKENTVQKDSFLKLKNVLTNKKEELLDGLGKDMNSVSFDDVKEQLTTCKDILEDMGVTEPKQTKLLNRVENLSKMFESGLKNPKALLLDNLEKSMEKDNLLDTYQENSCKNTILESHNDIKELKQGLKGLESIFAKNSKEFNNIKNALDKLDAVKESAKPGSFPRKKYTQALDGLVKATNQYLNSKNIQRGLSAEGKINANSSLENDRYEMVQKIKNYATIRKDMMRHQNLRDALKLNTYHELSQLPKNASRFEKKREFERIFHSNELNSVLDKADDQKIAAILRDKGATKEFAGKIGEKMRKTHEPLQRYRSTMFKAMDDKENDINPREHLTRLFMAEAMKKINPSIKPGELRRFEREMFDMMLSSDVVGRCVEETDLRNLDRSKAADLLQKHGGEFTSELRVIIDNYNKEKEKARLKALEEEKKKAQEQKEKEQNSKENNKEKNNEKSNEKIKVMDLNQVMEDDGPQLK